MTQYDDTNRGVLFRETEKKTPNHPDMRGNINVDGVEYWLSGWTKTSKDGSKKFLSLSVQPKEQQVAPVAGSADFDDAIPF